jgi:hypothetical protein
MSLYESLKKARKPLMYIKLINDAFEALNESPFLTENDKKDIKYKKLLKIYNTLKDVDITELIKLEKEKESKIYKQAIQKFMNYEVDSIRIKGKKDILRLSQNGKFIEASQSVKIPLDEAKEFYTKIKNNENIIGTKISNYIVNSFNGSLKVGCHEIAIDTVNLMGELILTI